jgi:nicotinamidase/pyrazinamidase
MKFLNFTTLIGLAALADSPGALAGGNTAVVVVDLQKDFTNAYNGSLAVNGTDEAYLKVTAKTTKKLKELGLPVYATQDWHPAGHVSFASSHVGRNPLETIDLEDGRTQILWPDHCVQGSDGAKLLLDEELLDGIVQKGANPLYDSYSGFKDDGGAITVLDKTLKSSGIKNLIVYGIATDFCVKFTVLDGIAAGYNLIVVRDLTPEIAPETAKEAWAEMEKNGAVIWPNIDLSKVKKLL